MSKSKNKAAARDWQEQQKADSSRQEMFEMEKERLWYAANKRKSNYPHPDVFEEMGMPDVATKIREAYALLETAYYMLPVDTAAEMC